ncbi:hypothetical protein DY218_06485 [Streptomyces triticagri]|uniref:Uncharacterized protein n=1 Tax=Streptomyces triticagri TaxID=2293568 RepID=A0A372M944_9ACTN|nr:hypothetical protein [Streptomyces triticagri]RFU87464.1 hypothetical protein DY218_06485 [Streptomyces triticagri]
MNAPAPFPYVRWQSTHADERGHFDQAVNPGAAAWFKPSATHLLERNPGYLDILAAHEVPCHQVHSPDPGRVVYEDEVQVVVVPYQSS